MQIERRATGVPDKAIMLGKVRLDAPRAALGRSAERRAASLHTRTEFVCQI